VLTLAQLRDQGDVPIGKLKRVVMHGRLAKIDLPKARDLLFETATAKKAKCSIAFHVSLKRNLGPRPQANGHVGLADRGKPSRRRVTKSGRD
jgi:hypothetical protein